MRTIKFRGKTLNGDWVYGACIPDSTDAGQVFIIDYANHERESYSWEEIDPETVGQFTGLADMGGLEIWEGDIVERRVYMRNHAECDVRIVEVYEVCYDTPGWSPFMDISQHMDEYEVVGNIHDDPQLIK